MGKRILSLFMAVVLSVVCVLVSAPEVSAADSASWKLNVNLSTNVVTVYQKQGKSYEPYRAMVCSAGGEKTPTGTYDLKKKWDWGLMVDGTYGRYVSQIDGDYLFHSVPYLKKGKKDQCDGTEYNKLGTGCSHGCVRLSINDVKWIYDNCPVGTEVKMFRGADADDPLGKPKPLKVENKPVWDPTERDPKNPDYRLRKAEIRISDEKQNVIICGAGYDLMKGVTAVNPNGNQDLTSKIKIGAVEYRLKDGTWKSCRFSVKRPGTYRITYQVEASGCDGVANRTWNVRVRSDRDAPVITAYNRRVCVGDRSAVKGVSAWQPGCNRVRDMKIYINAPGFGKEQQYSYEEAAAYIFEKKGTYRIRYVAENQYDAGQTAEKEIRVTVQEPKKTVTQNDMQSERAVTSVAAVSQADLQAAWIWNRQLPNGAFKQTGVSENLAYVDPHVNALAALTLLQHDDSVSARKQLQLCFDWYFAHLNGVVQDPSGQEGTVYSYDLLLSGDRVSEERNADFAAGINACSAAFLNALAEYVKHGGSEAYLRAYEPEINKIAAVMTAGLSKGYAEETPGSGSYDLQENCEVYTALRSVKNLYRQHILTNKESYQQVSQALDYYEKNFVKDWWKSGHFAVKLDAQHREASSFTWKTFSEKTAAQAYPLVYDVIQPGDKKAKKLYGKICNSGSWEKMKFGSAAGDRCYSVLEAAAAVMGDQDRFMSYLNCWQEKRSKTEVSWSMEERAMFVRACDIWNQR